MAAENDKAQGKQAEDESVFFRFGDDLAVDDNPHRAKSGGTITMIESSRKEVADGFVDQACSHPRRSLPIAIKQVGRLVANAQTIVLVQGRVYKLRVCILAHKQAGNGSGASAGDGDCGRVSGVGGKSDVGFASARNSGVHRCDVFGVGAGKQGRKSQQLVAGAVGVVKVAVVACNGSSVSDVVVAATSDAGGATKGCSAATTKYPEGLVGGVVLAGIDVDEKLRLGLFPRNQRKRRDEQRR